MYDVNVLKNAGSFNANDGNFYNILVSLLNVVQNMNPGANYTMQQLVAVLGSQPVDSPSASFDILPATGSTNTGMIYYLSCNSAGQLQLTVNRPVGDSGGSADGPASSVIQYYTTYDVAGGWCIDNQQASQTADDLKTLVDTSASLGAAKGDCNVHNCPYRGCSAAGNTNGYIYAEDMIQWTPGTGAATGSVNHGDLQFFESVGPSMQFAAIN
jgi:hypothetical protein